MPDEEEEESDADDNEPLELPEGDDEQLRPRAREAGRADRADRPSAQTVRERYRPELEPPHIHLGGFTLAPSVGTRVAYDGNVFGVTGGPDDVYASAEARASLTSNWRRHRLTIDSAISGRTYATYSTEDGIEYRVAATGRFDIARGYSVGAGLSHERVLADRSSVTEIGSGRRPTRHDRTRATVSVHAERARFSTDLSAAVAEFDYVTDSTLAGTPADIRFRDHRRTDLGAEIGYEIASAQSVFVRIERSRLRYEIDAVPRRDVDVTEAVAGLRSEITPLLRGRIGLGYIDANFADPALPDDSGLDIDARLDWLITELTTVHLAASRSLENAAFANAPSRLGTLVELGADHELLRNLILSAAASYETVDYSLSDRRASLFRLGISGIWTPNRSLQISARINFRRRDAENFVVPRSFSAFDAGISATWRF